MPWEAVNSETYETATHRVRRIGRHWIAERKSPDGEHFAKIYGVFDLKHEAQTACESDAENPCR